MCIALDEQQTMSNLTDNRKQTNKQKKGLLFDDSCLI